MPVAVTALARPRMPPSDALDGPFGLSGVAVAVSVSESESVSSPFRAFMATCIALRGMHREFFQTQLSSSLQAWALPCSPQSPM